jgi:hypothetical protein
MYSFIVQTTSFHLPVDSQFVAIVDLNNSEVEQLLTKTKIVK